LPLQATSKDGVFDEVVSDSADLRNAPPYTRCTSMLIETDQPFAGTLCLHTRRAAPQTIAGVARAGKITGNT